MYSVLTANNQFVDILNSSEHNTKSKLDIDDV